MDFKNIFFVKELFIAFISNVGINTITFFMYLIASRIVGFERLFYENSHTDSEGAINVRREYGEDSEEYRNKYAYSPMEKFGKKFKEKGMVLGVIYVIFEFLPEVFYSAVFAEASFLRRNDIIFIVDILLILVLRYFLFIVPGFSIFYIDILLFAYMLSTMLMLLGVILVPHGRNQVFNNYLLFITGTSVSFFVLLLFAFYYSTVQELNSTAVWLISYTLIIVPFGFLLMSGKLIASIFIESDKTNVARNMRSLFGNNKD